MRPVVPLKPLSIRYESGKLLPGGARFAALGNLRELAAFWDRYAHEFAYVARGRRWGSRQMFLNPGEWIFAPTIPALVRAVTRWEAMNIRVEWHSRSMLDPDEIWEYSKQAERLRRLMAKARRGREAGSVDTLEDGYWQLKLPASLRRFPWFAEHSDRVHYPGLTAAQAVEIFQLRTYEDWRQSNMREVDFMAASDLEDLISCCREVVQEVDL